MICSICVNTYKRPVLLKKLLLSFEEQELPQNTELEIIIVDNGPKQLGKKVAEEFKRRNNLKINYFVQPIKNISLTRNVAVKNATGEYILFVDDDAYADKSWVKNMVNSIIKYNADAVFGRVISYFDKETPQWLVKGGYFDRECPPTGDRPNFTRTGNCLIKSEVIKSIEGPFDLEYGLTGGSDTHLFETLFQKNFKYISCYEGVVYDFVHSKRANFNWLFKRSIRTGNTYTRRKLEYSNGFFIKLKHLIRACSFGLISLVLIILFVFSKQKRVYWSLKLAANIGHVMAIFNYHYKEYK